ncbi:MAG: VCBS repeat-containing protein [Phycisphaerae bacterium]|nr:VCBS repeat-containing protein [Phycisphaerae bacterium]
MDINNDGNIDVLSGSWPGEIFLFEGAKGKKFKAPVMLKNKNNEIINPGGGIEDRSNGGILIRGNADFETTDEGTFVNYHGKRIKNTPEKPISISGTATAVNAVDWDADGDYDLIVGNISGNVYLVPNEGDANKYAFGKEEQLKAGDELLGAKSRAGVCVADIDGDGDLDLLAGGDDGSVSFYENTGSAKKAKLAKAVEIIPPVKSQYGANTPTEPTRGTRSKLCAADWNGDGKLDLLVGDYARLKPDVPEPSDQEKAEHEKIRNELKSVQKRYSELANKMYGSEKEKDPAKIKKMREEMPEVRSKMGELRGKLPKEYETHGWVWLFLQK